MASETILSEALIQENLKQFLLVLAVSLIVATLSRTINFLRQIPYTLLLVIVGLGLAFFNVRLVNLSPGLILVIFLPPLLFEASWNLEWSHLRRDLVPICLYAVLGVAISVAGVALALHQFAGIALAIALLVGASVSATDPVSIIALFRELGVEKRLATLMEAESLFNDGTAVVAFSSLVGFSLGTSEFSIHRVFTSFFTVVGIGIGVGLVIGFAISYLTQRFNLPLVEQSLTLVSAYGTYIITENLHGSGVIGVVTTGLVLGNFGSRFSMQPSTRLAVSQFWEFLAFFVNSMVFLLIGDQISFTDLAANLGLITITVVAMLLTRAITVYGLGALSNWLANSQISIPAQTLLWWGGLRGSVSIAVALSFPTQLAERERMIATVFGVVLFTLLVEGLTTKPLLQKLGLLNRQPYQQYLEAIAHRVALNRVLKRLTQLGNQREIEPELYHHLATGIQAQLDYLQEKINSLHQMHPQMQKLIIEQLQKDLQAIEADTYAEFVRAGMLNEIPPFVLPKVFKQ